MEYLVELHQFIALIVNTYEEFDSKFAEHLETLAEFTEWFQPQFDAFSSILKYGMAWVDNMTNLSELPSWAADPSGAAAIHNENDVKPEDSVSELCTSLSDRHNKLPWMSQSRISK